MRTFNILFLSCVLLASIAAIAVASEPFVLEELHLIHWEDIPEGKPSYTGPVSAAILMAWYAEHGYPLLLSDLNGDGRINEEDTLLLARDFGEAMGGRLIDDKLGDPFIVYPLARYIAERYPNEFRMLVYDESFPEEVERDLGQPFAPTEVAGIVLDVLENPFYELYVHHLEAQRPGIVGIGFDIPEWNDFAVSRSYIPIEEPGGRPVDLASTGYEQFAREPVWETLMRLEPERWGFLMPEWVPFEILIILLPEDEEIGSPGQPGDGPGDDPGDPFDPGNDPGDPFDPGGDPRLPSFPFDPDGPGPCCLPDGSCAEVNAIECQDLGGTFGIPGLSCQDVDCFPRTDNPCAILQGEVTDLCYDYDRTSSTVTISGTFKIHNTGSANASNISAMLIASISDGVNVGTETVWIHNLTIPAGTTHTMQLVFTDTVNLGTPTGMYAAMWLQQAAPASCPAVIKPAVGLTQIPPVLCDGGTPPGGNSGGTPGGIPGESADLVITMNLVSPSSEPVADDSDPQYNLTVWNNGPDTAKNVVLKLTMPSEVKTLNAGLSPIYTATRPPNDAIEWHIGDKPVPAGKGVWFQVGVDAGFCGDLLYQFEVSSDTSDPDLSNNADTLTTQVGPCSGGTPPGGSGDNRQPGDPTLETGVCCMPDGSCDTTTADICAQRGGAFILGESCATYVCPRQGTSLCAQVDGEITDICYTYEGGILTVYASYAITNHGPVAANDITAYALVGLNDGVNGLGGGPECQNWKYGIDIPSGGTYTYDHVFSTSAPSLDLSKLSYLYGSLWLQVEAPWDCWPILKQDFVQTWDPAPLCNPSSSGTPPGGSNDGQPTGTPPGGTDSLAGACCLPDGSCDSLSESACSSRDGLFYGPNTNCAEIRCFPSEDPPCPIVYSTVLSACQLYQGPSQPMIVKADFRLTNPGGKDALNVVVKLIAGVPLLPNLVTTYNDTYSFTIPVIPAGGSMQFSHTFSINPAPPQQPTGQTVVMMFAAPITPLCKPNIQSATQLFHLLTFGPSERICPEDEGTPPGGEGDIIGACCLPDGSCQALSVVDCRNRGGQYQGDGVACSSVTCDGGESEPDPEPDPQPTLLPNLWVTGMTGCWTWSSGGDEHVIATVTGIVHNGGQADASNVRARVTAGGKSTTVTVGSISAGGQKTVSATIDVGAYDTTSWPVSTSITADPLHQITEADESNNTTNSSFPQSSDCN